MGVIGFCPPHPVNYQRVARLHCMLPKLKSEDLLSGEVLKLPLA
jgi:hypothetical protein